MRFKEKHPKMLKTIYGLLPLNLLLYLIIMCTLFKYDFNLIYDSLTVVLFILATCGLISLADKLDPK